MRGAPPHGAGSAGGGHPLGADAVGEARWTGAPLRELLALARPSRRAVAAVLEGADRGPFAHRAGEFSFARCLPLANTRSSRRSAPSGRARLVCDRLGQVARPDRADRSECGGPFEALDYRLGDDRLTEFPVHALVTSPAEGAELAGRSTSAASPGRTRRRRGGRGARRRRRLGRRRVRSAGLTVYPHPLAGARGAHARRADDRRPRDGRCRPEPARDSALEPARLRERERRPRPRPGESRSGPDRRAAGTGRGEATPQPLQRGQDDVRPYTGGKFARAMPRRSNLFQDVVAIILVRCSWSLRFRRGAGRGGERVLLARLGIPRLWKSVVAVAWSLMRYWLAPTAIVLAPPTPTGWSGFRSRRRRARGEPLGGNRPAAHRRVLKAGGLVDGEGGAL